MFSLDLCAVAVALLVAASHVVAAPSAASLPIVDLGYVSNSWESNHFSCVHDVVGTASSYKLQRRALSQHSYPVHVLTHLVSKPGSSTTSPTSAMPNLRSETCDSPPPFLPKAAVPRSTQAALASSARKQAQHGPLRRVNSLRPICPVSRTMSRYSQPKSKLSSQPCKSHLKTPGRRKIASSSTSTALRTSFPRKFLPAVKEVPQLWCGSMGAVILQAQRTRTACTIQRDSSNPAKQTKAKASSSSLSTTA